jgi:hypothetical protein
MVNNGTFFITALIKWSENKEVAYGNYFCNFVLEYFFRNRKFEYKINIFHINVAEYT